MRGVPPPKREGLSPQENRFDEVVALRQLSDREWSIAAGLSPGYVKQQRYRASTVEAYRLPEDGAAALAEAANIHAEWLRFGTGPRDLVAPGAAPVSPNPATSRTREPRDCELALAEAFQRGVGRFSARDFLATLDLIREGELMLPDDREKAVLAAGRLLGVVSKLRRNARPVTSDTIAGELLADDANTEGLAQLAALGAAPPAVPVRTPARGTPAVSRVPKAIVRDRRYDPDADDESGAPPDDAAAGGTARR